MGCTAQSISLWNVAQKAAFSSHEKYNILCRMMYSLEPWGLHSCLYCVGSSLSLLLLSCKYHCRDFLRTLTVDTSNRQDWSLYGLFADTIDQECEQQQHIKLTVLRLLKIRSGKWFLFYNFMYCYYVHLSFLLQHQSVNFILINQGHRWNLHEVTLLWLCNDCRVLDQWSSS